jgi:ATP-binding cassette subfamily B protein
LFADVISVLQQTVTLLSVIVVLFAWDPWTAVLIVVAPLPALAANLHFGRRGFEIEHRRAADRRHAAYLQALIVNDQAYKEIHLLRLGPELLRRYLDQLRSFYAADRSLARRRTVVSLPLGLLSVAVAGGALLRALLDTIARGTIGQFTGFVQAIGTVSNSAALLVGTAGQLHQNALFVSNLFEFLDLPESTIRGGDRRFPQRLTYGIEFRNVTFTYPGTSTTAIRGLSCLLPAGSCVAVVGPNGAGKTTLVKLLTRLYEPTSGQILVDGVPIDRYDLADLRRGIGVIFQDFVQYELSAAENIGFGRIEDLTDEARIRWSARMSGAATALETLPDGYQTTLGRMFRDGHQLSIGQWQRVALARAFMSRAPVVILDEPTASIDANAEAEIFDRLHEITAGATAILIAHRFSTVRMADHILVLAGGRLVESGTHEQLLDAHGTYAHLYTIQASAYRTVT